MSRLELVFWALRRRWRAWKRRQPSRTRYITVPDGTRLVASGMVTRLRVVELRDPAGL